MSDDVKQAEPSIHRVYVSREILAQAKGNEVEVFAVPSETHSIAIILVASNPGVVRIDVAVYDHPGPLWRVMLYRKDWGEKQSFDFGGPPPGVPGHLQTPFPPFPPSPNEA